MPVPFGFPSATLVDTPSGRRPIGELRVGEVVTTYNVTAGEAGRATITAVHHDTSHHLVEVVTSSGSLRGCTPGTGVFDAFEDMFRASASLSSLSEVLYRSGDLHEVLPTIDLVEHHAPDTVVHQLTLDGTVGAFFADGILVKHRTSA